MNICYIYRLSAPALFLSCEFVNGYWANRIKQHLIKGDDLSEPKKILNWKKIGCLIFNDIPHSSKGSSKFLSFLLIFFLSSFFLLSVSYLNKKRYSYSYKIYLHHQKNCFVNSNFVILMIYFDLSNDISLSLKI